MKVGCYLKYKRIPYRVVHVSPVTRSQVKFTGQPRVPVLAIDGEWRLDSTPLGTWLDEVFPERSILGESESDREQILAIDDWITAQLIPSLFRHAVEWDSTWDSLRNGWILARTVNYGTPIPMPLRLLWPFLVRRAGFIQKVVAPLRSEPMPAMRTRLLDEFLEHLGGGPFLGGRETVSLADLSAYPTVVSSYLMGCHGSFVMLQDPEILAWCHRVQAHLPSNPLAAADRLLQRSLPLKPLT